MSEIRESNQILYNNFTLNHAKIGMDPTTSLAWRDLPFVLNEHLFSKNIKRKYKVLDFGCGTGTSIKIFKDLFLTSSFEIEMFGVDINEKNIKVASERNPDAKLFKIDKNIPMNLMSQFDLILCYLVLLENSYNDMVNILRSIRKSLNEKGIVVVVNCTSKAYDQNNDWCSFYGKYSENNPSYDENCNKLKLRDGQRVKMTVFDKHSAAEFTFTDYFHRRQTYKKAYHEAGLMLIASRKPLGYDSDEKPWKSEKHSPPFRIDVLCKRIKSKPERKNSLEINAV